jgi:hypothetical protein
MINYEAAELNNKHIFEKDIKKVSLATTKKEYLKFFREIMSLTMNELMNFIQNY